MNYFSALTPYIIPPELPYKKTNLGDGFILNAIRRLLNFSELRYTFSTKRILSDEDINKINGGRALIIAGANQLNDEYLPWPGFSLDVLEKIKVPVIPMGVGYAGNLNGTGNRCMSSVTKGALQAIHENIQYSSWRCFRTTRYLNESLPELADKFLMTGCPVIYGEKLLSGYPFSEKTEKIIFTPTERGHWRRREYATLNYILDTFPGAEVTMVLHQDFSQLSIRESFYNLKNNFVLPRHFHAYARKRGVIVIAPRTADEGEEIYNNCDLHIGSRLHAHIYSLSMCKKSFLTHVDGRAEGFAEYVQFPIVDYTSIGNCAGFDFEIYRRAAIDRYREMAKFTNSLKNIL